MTQSRKSAAQAILEQAKERFDGQTMDPKKLETARQQMAETAGESDQQEAAAFTEEIIRWFNSECNARDFTPEQRVFALALAFINFREGFPEAKGGAAKFKELAQVAANYYKENIT